MDYKLKLLLMLLMRRLTQTSQPTIKAAVCVLMFMSMTLVETASMQTPNQHGSESHKQRTILFRLKTAMTTLFSPRSRKTKSSFVLSSLKRKPESTANESSKPKKAKKSANVHAIENEPTESRIPRINRVENDFDYAFIPRNAQHENGDPMNLDRELNGTTTIRDDDDDSDAIVAVAMEALDDQITEAEYAAVAKQTWDRLKVAVVDYRGPGGLVENLVDLTKPMTRERTS
ncbi:hypothetical protein MHU86_5355 [Fragilaria crotonensis]|nr:hypothetical protein MHU86_5355 [Fragilaria crotonensis]